MKAAEVAADGIIEDLSDRRGLRQEWDQIDEDIQKEIRGVWQAIVVKVLKESNPYA